MISLYPNKNAPAPSSSGIRLYPQAGAGSGPTPQTGGGIKLSSDASSAPASTTPFYSGNGYGASSGTDVSGKPFATVPMTIPQTFMSPKTSVSVIDRMRTATTFDPTKAQKIDAKTLANPHNAGLSESIRKELGATAMEQLDHIIPVSLGGSYDMANLRLEPTTKGVNTATDPVEAKNWRDAIAGNISVIQALRNIAKAKGIPIKEDAAKTGPVDSFLLNHGKILTGLAGAQGAIEGVGSAIRSAPKDFFNFVSGLVEKSPVTQFASDADVHGFANAIKDAWNNASNTTVGPKGKAFSSLPQSLDAADINNIIARRAELVKNGVDPKKATMQATQEVRSKKAVDSLNNAVMGSVGGEGGDISAIDRKLADATDVKKITEIIKSRNALTGIRMTDQELANTAEHLKSISTETGVRNEFQRANLPVASASPEAKAIVEEAGQGISEQKTQLPPSTIDEAKEAFTHTIPSSELDVNQKVNLLDYFRTSDKVLQKIGLGNQANKLREAFDGYKSDLVRNITYLRGLVQQAPGEESARNIFRYLDGQPGAETLLKPNEMKVAEEIKGYLANWAEKLGLPKDARISNYITHIFEQGLIKKEFDPELERIIADRVPGSVYDPFLEQRLGAKGYVENVWQALDAYVKRATRKVNMDPALKSIQGASDYLDQTSLKYIKRYVDQINMRPTEIDNLLDNLLKQSPLGYKLGQRPTLVITRGWRNLIYRSTLGMNLGSALKNLTQGANTYAKLGEKYTIRGYWDLLTKGADELYQNGVLDNDLIQDKHMGVLKGLGQKLDTTFFSLFELAEKINRGSAYFGAKAQGMSLGMTEEKAIAYAKRIVRDTQFQFSSIDTPVALQSDIMKTIAQLQTFNLKQIEFLAGMVQKKEYAGIVRWLGASLGMVYTIGRVIGMNPSDLIPTIRIGGTPLGTLASGIFNSMSSNAQTSAQGKADLMKLPWLLIPGGAQLRKTIGGFMTVKEGRSTTPAGKTRYKVSQTPSNYIRGALFGTQGLPENQNYYSGVKPPKNAGSTASSHQGL